MVGFVFIWKVKSVDVMFVMSFCLGLGYLMDVVFFLIMMLYVKMSLVLVLRVVLLMVVMIGLGNCNIVFSNLM